MIVTGAPLAGGAHAEEREREQRDGGEQKDDRERGEEDVEGDLVRRLLAFGAFDHRDHAIEERLARIGRDLDDEPVGEDARAGDDGAAIASALADDRRALSGDRALVHRRDALDDLAIGRHEVAGLDEHVVPLAELRGRYRLGHGIALRLRDLLRRNVLAGLSERVRLRLAAPFGHGLGEVGEEDREPEPKGYGQDEAGGRFAFAHEGLDEQTRGEDAADLDDEHDRVSHLVAQVELSEGVDDGASTDGRL